MFIPSAKITAISLACVSLSACVTQPQAPNALIFSRSVDSAANSNISNSKNSTIPKETALHPGPKAPDIISGNLRPNTPVAKINNEGGDLTVALEQMPLPGFIQAVYGGILQLNYSIDAAVNSRTDLVTFRTPKPISAAQLHEVAGQLLKSYGVAVQDFGGVIRITPSTTIASTLPLVRRGRAQPTVPLPLRPVFHYVETEAVKPDSFLATLKTILGEKVKVDLTQLGGILISGQPDDVQVALELVQVFDQPTLRGQNSMRIVPRFWGAEDFSRRLAEVLKAEGYAVSLQAGSSEPITLLALPPINSVLIFSSTKEALAHTLDWVKELDQLSAVQAGSAFFTYPVKNTDAQELAKSLNDLITGNNSSTANAQSQSSGSGSSAPSSSSARQRRVVVNNATNSLIFQGGSQEDYRQWLSLLSELDRPVKSALIDVLVAEVALKDENDLGFSWKLDQLGSGASAVKLSGTTFAAQADGNGLSINALLGGNPLRQLAINALATNSESRVISNPKIITRNGEAANISVGQEVPTVTSQAVTNNPSFIGGSNTVVPQTIQYRNTGVLLKVRPVIHSGDRIDLEVSQEVSSAESTVTGVTTSPTIRKRSVETKLSLRDGATIMLGGLISETHTDSDSGVPFLKDIPVMGNIFKSSKRSKDRTELVMLITPYILNDSSDAESATDAYQDTLGDWSKSVRDRVNASRKAREHKESSKIQPENITQNKEVIEPKNDIPKNKTSSDSSLDKENTTEVKPKMINISTQNADFSTDHNTKNSDGNIAPSVESKKSNNSFQNNKSAPTSIEGIKTPEGAKIVDDADLLNEIKKSFNR